MGEGLLFCCRRLAATVAAVVIAYSSASAQTFSEVYSRFDEPLGPVSETLAVADFDGDGRNDLLAGQYLGDGDGTREARLAKAPLHLFVAVEPDGTFRRAPELIEVAIEARTPIVVADDFNGDGRPDLAVFDAGVYVPDGVGGYGNPPQLFLSSEDGLFRPSDALAEAVGREHELRPESRYSGPADLHVKTATAGDIDDDGDVDLWVESTGGANVSSHFMVNNGVSMCQARWIEEMLGPDRRRRLASSPAYSRHGQWAA